MLILVSTISVASVKPLKNFILAPGTVSATSATLLWDKPDNFTNIACYCVYVDGKEVATTKRCNYRLTGLEPETSYSVSIKILYKNGILSLGTEEITFRTSSQGRILNVTDFGAKGDGTTLNTQAIQKAIDACPENGTVLIPAGKFLSGALFLKSNMTLEIAKDGILKGSLRLEDYLPFIHNRYTGWELDTYASLINAGKMDSKGDYTVRNLVIKGEGTISGGGPQLGLAQKETSGGDSRARLILLMNCLNVDIQGLHIKDSPSWTIHFIYSKGVTLHDLDIYSTARNGDGINPDSSDDTYIFNCTFSTGDDCIAIKSGKNPDGYVIGRPTRNVCITDCIFNRGHGISIGSEISGGISNVLIRDCIAGPLNQGMQIKSTKARGGYVKDVRVIDCDLQKITIYSALPYGNEGEPAPEIPVYENFIFKNITLEHASIKEPVININGWEETGHRLKNVLFEHILLPDSAEININNAEKITFRNVHTQQGMKPLFKIVNSINISH